MRCHQKEITYGWLVNEEIDNYHQYLTDAFTIQILNHQKHALQGEQREQIDADIHELKENALEQKEDNQALRNECIVNKNQELQEYIMFKKGGTFGSITQRPCILTKHGPIQTNQGGQQTKQFGSPIKYEIEQKDQLAKNSPQWDLAQQKNQARIVFQYQKHTPIWIYLKDALEAIKYRNYFVCQRTIESKENLMAVVEESKALYYDIYAATFCEQLSQYSIKTAEQRKKAAKISQKEKSFFENIDQNLMKMLLLKKWFNFSKNIRKREDQQKELEDAEKMKLESIRYQNEQKKENWRKFLLSKQVLKIDTLEQIKGMMVDWLEKAEEIQYHQQVKSLTFQFEFKSLNIDESVYLIKPLLKVKLKSQIVDDVSSQMGGNANRVISTLSMDAFLGHQRTDKYYNWYLKEKQFEQGIVGQQKSGNITRRSCQINIANLQMEDELEFQFQDMINSFYDSNTDYCSIKIQKILENVQQGRTIWIPLQLEQTTPLKTEMKRSIIFAELDIFVEPSLVMKSLTNFTDELSYICQNNQPTLDPIYLGTFLFPKLNKETIKIVIILLSANNQCLKLSLQMLNYILFMSELEDKQFEVQVHQLTVLCIRKMIEVLCCQGFINLEKQQKIFEIVSSQVQDGNLLFNKNPQINQNIQQLYYGGIPYYLRNKLWFYLLKGSYRNMLQILTKLKIDPENRKLLNEQECGVTICESVWYYWKLLRCKTDLNKNLQILIDQYMRAEDGRKAIVNERFYHMLKNMLSVYVLYYQKLDKQLNPIFIQHIFTLGKKILSLQNYHYIPFRNCYSFINDNEEESQQTEFVNQQYRECSYESRGFWLLIAFTNEILAEYPIFSQSKRVFLEDCARIRAFLKRNHKKLLNHIFLLGASFENLLYECFFNLYSDILPSELLFRVWDLVIFQQQLSIKDTKERGYILSSVMCALLVKLEDKIQYITTQMNFLAALRIVASLINNYDSFMQFILEVQQKMIKAVQLELEEEGPLQLFEQDETLIKIDVRAFDNVTERAPKPSQQMSLHQYMNSIDF